MSRISLSSGNTSILETATFDSATETLVFGKASVTQSSVTGTNGTESITPYSFTDVSVPVVSSNNQVTTSKVVTTSTTIATGSLNSSDAVGATVMTGLGTATTASAITSLPTASAAGQTITVGDNDLVTVLTDDTSVSVD